MAAERWLTVREVEDIHRAVTLDDNVSGISAVVDRLSASTLPALIEYGCLRWAFPRLPALPVAVQNSAIGRSLALVASPFGFRSGVSAPCRRDLKPRQSEFWVFKSVEDVTSDDAEFFQSRFWKSARNVGIADNIAKCLAAGLHEMMTNAVQHSRSLVPMLAGYAVYPQFAQFAVADVGEGVLAALRRDPQYGHVIRHYEAVRLALHDGVSSDPTGNGGFGFHDIFKAIAEQWGYLRFRSGDACLLADGARLDADAGQNHPVLQLPGFQVSVSCRAAEAAPTHPTT